MSQDAIREIDTAAFESEIAASPLPTVLDVYTTGCAPCRMLKPLLAQVAVEYAGRVKVCALDAEANVDVAVRLAVQAFPTLLFFRDGQVVGASRGLVSVAALRARFERLAAGELP